MVKIIDQPKPQHVNSYLNLKLHWNKKNNNIVFINLFYKYITNIFLTTSKIKY